ncbi:MAG TPA: asparagine synthase B, partial [Dyella sp.]
MCAIFGMFDIQPGDDLAALRQQALELSQRQRHRGPDWSGVFVDAGVILVHERLAIVDPASGSQPLRSRDGALALAVNGEIYNHRALRAASGYDFTTGSDCEVINALYRDADDSANFVDKLNGIFAFALWDGDAQRYLIARDPVGVCPLYWGHDSQGRLCVASEMKALVGICHDVAPFPPGHVYDSVDGRLRRYYRKPWREHEATRGHNVEPAVLREAFEQAVHRQLMTDVPYGVLL